MAGCPDEHMSMRGAALLEFNSDGKLEDRLDAPFVDHCRCAGSAESDCCSGVLLWHTTTTCPDIEESSTRKR